MPPSYSLRPINGSDQEFLYSVYASTRQDELSVVPWTEMEKEAFLRQQFNAQHRYYSENFADAQFQVIEEDGQAVGRLYLHRRPAELNIIDIALLPECRRQGLGSAMLQDVLDEGQRTGKRVTIHVERNNPALRLYTRLGFHLLEDQGVYYFMEWQPKPED
jgi:ribosomal protein S18 acetylase RimI-like enzyme